MERRRRVLEQAELCKSEGKAALVPITAIINYRPTPTHRILWLDFANAQTGAQTVKAEKEVVDKEL